MNKIAPGKLSAWFTVLVFTPIFLIGVWGLLKGQYDWAFIPLMSGLIFGGFMVPSLFDVHAVSWDESKVCGTGHMFGLSLGWRKSEVYWESLSKFGSTLTGYYYLEDHQGKRVYWSYLYTGYRGFMEFARSKRPDLEIYG